MEFKYIEPQAGLRVVECYKGGMHVGYIVGNDQENGDGTFFNYIEHVKVELVYQGEGICKNMLQFYINTLEPLHYTHFSLHNTGGIGACKCYISAFSACGYSAYSNSNRDEQYRLNRLSCEKPETNRGMMFFFKTYHSHGGSHRSCRRTRRRNKKNKKI